MKSKWIHFLLGALLVIVYSLMLFIHHLQLEQIELLESIKAEIQNDIDAYVIEHDGVRPRWIGIASYYSEEGCVGCREDLLMANGEKYDEKKYTVAFNKVPLGSWVSVRNTYTDDTTYARVTDTGGFEDLGRIIDLSVAVKDAISCTDLCHVEVTAL